MLFDLNDFDEAATGPWEWDVKRLATSIVGGGRDRGLGEGACRRAAEAAVRTCPQALCELFDTSVLQRHLTTVDTD